jgi:hypothetical protein
MFMAAGCRSSTKTSLAWAIRNAVVSWCFVIPWILRWTTCKYDDKGFTCPPSEGEYFMMGDNLDSSADSRYWAFVPDRNIVGNAFFIWLDRGELKCIGTRMQ